MSEEICKSCKYNGFENEYCNNCNGTAHGESYFIEDSSAKCLRLEIEVEQLQAENEKLKEHARLDHKDIEEMREKLKLAVEYLKKIELDPRYDHVRSAAQFVLAKLEELGNA